MATTTSDMQKAEAAKAKQDSDAAESVRMADVARKAEERKQLLDADVFVPKDLQEKAEGIARDEMLIRAEAARQQLARQESEAQGIRPGKTEAQHVWDVAMTRAVEKVKAEEAGEKDVRYTGSDTLIEGAEAVKEFDEAQEKEAEKQAGRQAKTAKTAKTDPKGTPKNTAGENARKAADGKTAAAAKASKK